jgi:hypothetical protein
MKLGIQPCGHWLEETGNSTAVIGGKKLGIQPLSLAGNSTAVISWKKLGIQPCCGWRKLGIQSCLIFIG